MIDDLPLEHVRRPALPWRDLELTECGLPLAGHPVITRDEFRAKYKRQGHQRACLTTCQTCLDTANRHRAWEDDPISALQREFEAAVRYTRRAPGTRDVVVAELRAIAILISRHRGEFDELLADQRETVPIASAKRTPHVRPRQKW